MLQRFQRPKRRPTRQQHTASFYTFVIERSIGRLLQHPDNYSQSKGGLLLLWLMFFFFHIRRIGCQPGKTTSHGGQSRSWSVEHGKENKKRKSSLAAPPPPCCSYGGNKNKIKTHDQVIINMIRRVQRREQNKSKKMAREDIT